MLHPQRSFFFEEPINLECVLMTILSGVAMHKGEKRLEVFPKENFHHHLMKNQSGRCNGIFIIVYKNFYMAPILLYPVTCMTITRAEKQRIKQWFIWELNYPLKGIYCALPMSSWLTSTHWEYLQGTFYIIYMHTIFSYLNVTNCNISLALLPQNHFVPFHSVPFHIPCITVQ